MSNAVTRVLAAWIEGGVRLVPLRKPDVIVGDDPDNPYLRRWFLIPRNRFFNVYLHEFLRDDEDRALHDHPWPSLSLSLSRNKLMREIYRTTSGDMEREIKFGDVVRRGARFTHRMLVPHPGSLTLFLTGPRIRDWGFHCPKGWVIWTDFVDRADGVHKVGRGCGEMQ